jgi:hypothetical protein
MSPRDHTETEARLRSTLQAIARVVPDEPPAAAAPVPGEPLPVELEPARGSVRPDPTRPSRPAWPSGRQVRVLVAAGIALVALLVGGIVVLARDDTHGRERVETPAAPATHDTPTTTIDPNSVAVPNVVGKSSADAEAALTAAGFASYVTTVPSSQPAGTVVAQDPATGRAPRGSLVTLNVSLGS